MPVIQIVAFQGTGGMVNRENPYFDTEEGLVRAGHVGLKGVFPDIIIGFSPTPEAAQAVGGEQPLLDQLYKHRAFSGCFQNDTRHFEKAHALTDQTESRTSVWEIDVEISEKTLETLKKWYNTKYIITYNLPNQEPPEFEADEYNCATILQHPLLNIPTPVESGKLAKFIDAMIDLGATKWEAKDVNP